jgi:hypothetical protein
MQGRLETLPNEVMVSGVGDVELNQIYPEKTQLLHGASAVFTSWRGKAVRPRIRSFASLSWIGRLTGDAGLTLADDCCFKCG